MPKSLNLLGSIVGQFKLIGEVIRLDIEYKVNTDKGYECTECGNIDTVNYRCCELCGNDEWEPVGD